MATTTESRGATSSEAQGKDLPKPDKSCTFPSEQEPQEYADDSKKSDKRSDTGSASGPPGSGKSGVASVAMMKRRMSRWRHGGGRKMSVSATSLTSRERMSLQKVENTYKTDPDDGTKFSVAKVKAVTESALTLFLGGGKNYDSSKYSSVSQYLADDIKNRVKELGFARYKIVVHVMLGQNADQSMEVASRCVWDVNNDNMASVTVRRGDMYAIACVFGTYYQ